MTWIQGGAVLFWRSRCWRVVGAAVLGLAGCRSPGADLAAVKMAEPLAVSELPAFVRPGVTRPGEPPADAQVIQTAAHEAAPLPPESGRSAPDRLPEPPPTGGAKAGGKSDVYRPEADLAGPAAGFFTPLIPACEDGQTLSLAEALYRAGVENPQIAIAEQAVQVSLALQMQARALLLPSLTGGGNYHLHNGSLQASFGAIRNTTEDSLYMGAGARTVAAETVAYPGVRIYAQLAEAFFEPKIAREVVAVSQFQAVATRNNILLAVSLRYLALLRAESELALIRQSQADFAEVVRLTSNFAKAGAGSEADAARARTRALLLQTEEQAAQGEVAAASAELARYLNLDPSCRLNTGNDPIKVVQFVDPATPLPRLLEIASLYRPELMAAAAAIRAGEARVREEKARPFLPLLLLGYSDGSFGGGSTISAPFFGRFNNRADYDAMAVWTLQNAGLGNLALIRARKAELDIAVAQRIRTFNQVNQQVADGYNLSAARFQQIEVARRELKSALDAYQHDLSAILGGVRRERPLELIRSAEMLLDARRRLVASLIGFDEAQFQLFVALGQPPNLVVPTPGKPAHPDELH